MNASVPAAPLTALQQSLAIALNITDEGRELTQVLWRFPSRPDIERLERTWSEVMSRHEALRLYFTKNPDDSLPVQQVAAGSVAPRIKEVNTEVPESMRDAALHERLIGDRDSGVNIETSPAWRLSLFRFASNDFVLVWTVPHVLLDDYSIGRIMAEVAILYRGKDKPPVPSPESWLAHARAQHHLERNASLEWWKKHLSGLPPIAKLPKSNGSRHPEAFAGRTLDSELAAELDAFAKDRGVTVGTLTKTAWLLLLWNQTGAKDNLIGQILMRRDVPAPHVDLVGMISNILPLRVVIDPNQTPSSLIQTIKGLKQELQAQGNVALESVLRAAGYQPGATRFQSLINYEENHFLAAARDHLEHGQSIDALRHYAVPVVLNVTRHPELRARLYLQEDLMQQSAADRLLGQFEHILRLIIAQPETAIRELELISPEDRTRTVEEFNRTDADIEPNLCIHHPFERLAASHPDRVAVVGTDATYTYGELEAKANQLANYLIAKGVKPRGRILLSLEKSARMIVAMFATHKCGCAYVPVDPAWPRERVEGILSTLDAEAFVCSSEHPMADLAHPRRVLLDTEREFVAAAPTGHPGVVVDDTAIAYIIFTSGSTGTPKGVQIPHRGIVNTLHAFNTHFAYGPDDKAFCITACTFDPSIHDIFGLLSVGGAVVLCPAQAGRDPETWGKLILQHRITSWCSVPQLVQMLFEYHREQAHKLASLRVVRMGGDALPMSLPNLIWSVCPHAQIANEGGVTEVSVCTTLQPVRAVDPSWNSVPYGRPLINQSVYILDENLHPSPTLVSGDMYFGGRSLGEGYWKDEERTKKAYIIHPRWNMRLYRTGDRGRFLDSGDLEFLGREDHQVKLGGFRIELGEIETTIRLLPWVKEAVTIKREVGAGGEALVAYVVPDQSSHFDAEAVKEQCRGRLPHYMVPAIVISVPKMPLTANGKVDRKALPEPMSAPVEEVTWNDDEKIVADIWKEVLGQAPDSPDRPFFEAGGTSLLALRLIDVVKRRTGHVLTMASLYKVRPSVRRMATDIAARRRRTASPFGETEEPVIKKWIVPLQPRGSRPPLFMLGSHHVLGRYVSEDQPYYAIHVTETVRNDLPGRSLSDIASLVLREIKRFQPEGPYYIAGYGFSAAIAFELARYIRSKEEVVAYLALVEPAVPAAVQPPIEIPAATLALRGSLGGWFGAPLAWPKNFKAMRRRLTNRLEHASKGLSDFVPTHLDIPFDLILARRSPEALLGSKDPRLAWKNWSQKVEEIQVYGNDHTLIREPLVEAFARLIETRLIHASASHPSSVIS